MNGELNMVTKIDEENKIDKKQQIKSNFRKSFKYYSSKTNFEEFADVLSMKDNQEDNLQDNDLDEFKYVLNSNDDNSNPKRVSKFAKITKTKSKPSLQEIEVVCEKVIYKDEVSCYCVFRVKPRYKIKSKTVHCDLEGFFEKDNKNLIEKGFSVVLEKDFIGINYIQENANLVCLGRWEWNEYQTAGGRQVREPQFKSFEVSMPKLSDDESIKSFIEKKGFKSLQDDELIEFFIAAYKNKVHRQEKEEGKKPKNVLIDVLNSPILIRDMLTNQDFSFFDIEDDKKEKKHKYLPKNIALDWFFYNQSELFSSALKGFELGRAKAITIFNTILTKFKLEEVIDLRMTSEKHFEEKADKSLFLKFIEVFDKNPYDFICINGIGFKTIDTYFLNRFDGDIYDPRRLKALITHFIDEKSAKTGSTFFPYEELRKEMLKLGRLTNEDCYKLFNQYRLENKIIGRKLLGNNEVFFTTNQLFCCEFRIVKKINDLKNFKLKINDKAIKEIQSKNFNNDESQSQAVLNSYQNPVSIITGGPGSGKTTTIKKLVHIFAKYEKDMDIVLLAPTGKAAKRIDEAIKLDDKLKKIEKLKKPLTLHRYYFQEKGKKGDSKPAIYIIDESSMIGTKLMDLFLKMVAIGSRVILVGDIDQIPPVEIGQIMRDFIESKKIPISYLTNIHRVSEDSKIPENARLINQGIMPKDYGDFMKNDYSFIPCESDNEIFLNIERVIKTLLENNLCKKEDIQIISPQQTGDVGVNNLNKYMRWLLNDTIDISEYNVNKFRNINEDVKKLQFNIGDRIINNKNNYDLNIFNGEMAIVDNRDVATGLMTIKTCDEGKYIDIEKSLKPNFSFAYTITVHKSQGSESPIIIMPISKAHTYILNKFLIYTGVTRAKNKVILIGNTDTFVRSLKKNQQGSRLTSIKVDLSEENEEKLNKLEKIYVDIINDVTYVENELEMLD